jgi:hypothetical protein
MTRAYIYYEPTLDDGNAPIWKPSKVHFPQGRSLRTAYSGKW